MGTGHRMRTLRRTALLLTTAVALAACGSEEPGEAVGIGSGGTFGVEESTGTGGGDDRDDSDRTGTPDTAATATTDEDPDSGDGTTTPGDDDAGSDDTGHEDGTTEDTRDGGATGSTAGQADGAVTTDQIAAASAGLDRWLTTNRPATPRTSSDLPGCPAIALADLEQAFAPYGLDAPLGDWRTEIEWDEYEDVDPDLMGLVCGGDTDGDAHDSDSEVEIALAVVDLQDRSWTEFADAMGIADLPSADLPRLGGSGWAVCEEDQCLAAWHAPTGLVLVLQTEGATLDAPRLAGVLDDLGPAVLDTLAAH